MSETVRWLRFQDAGQSYAVDEARVRSVEGSERLQPNPRPSGPLGWLLGVESDLPVASLSRPARVEAREEGRFAGGGGGEAARAPRFRMARPARPAAGQVIVLETGGGTTGLWADAVSGREEVPVSRLRRLPPVAGTDLFCRMAMPAGPGGDIVLEVAPDAVRERTAAGDFRLPPVPQGLPASETLPTSPPVLELPPAHGEGERRLLLFATGRPGGLPFGLNARQALEMLRPRQVRPVPGAQPHLLGLVSWRGEPIAALDLEARLGLAGDPATVRRLLVVRSRDQEEVAAFLVDRVVAILQQPFRHRRLPLPPGIRADLLHGVYEEAGQSFILPDIDRVLQLPEAPGEPVEAGGAPSYWA
jgi:purine-binding chemotaxis protein CheW